MAKVAGIPNFKASVSQTKNGNDYKKTRLCTTVGTLAGAAAAGADIFIAASKNNGFSLVRKVKSVLPQAGVLLGTGIATGLVFDYVLNKLSAKKADKNPMPVELKFARDLKSKDYSPRYDVELDEVILVHKKDNTCQMSTNSQNTALRNFLQKNNIRPVFFEPLAQIGRTCFGRIDVISCYFHFCSC